MLLDEQKIAEKWHAWARNNGMKGKLPDNGCGKVEVSPEAAKHRQAIADYLSDNPGVGRRELAEHLGVSPNTVSNNLKVMRRKGIVRVVNPGGGKPSRNYLIEGGE